MIRTYAQVKEAVKAKGYAWFEGAYNLNYIWERTSDDFTNKFTDFLHVCYQETKDGAGTILTIPVTTKPGTKGSVLDPITVRGVTGTAIIKPGQYRGSWQFRDTFDEFSKYPYFRQVKPIDYWRDGDKDLVVDRVNDEEDKINVTHWHIMSQVNKIGSGQVNNWSLGCMGGIEDEFEKILPVTRKSVAIYGLNVTGTIMESKDF